MDTVLLAFRHDLGCAVKPLLDGDHLRAGEPFLASSVPAQPNKLRRSLHRAHNGIELFQSIRMAVGKYREVAAREGRLLARDRVQGDMWIGDDPFAILVSDLAMLFKPFPL